MRATRAGSGVATAGWVGVDPDPGTRKGATHSASGPVRDTGSTVRLRLPARDVHAARSRRACEGAIDPETPCGTVRLLMIPAMGTRWSEWVSRNARL